jgi:hypothetical protein
MTLPWVQAAATAKNAERNTVNDIELRLFMANSFFILFRFSSMAPPFFSMCHESNTFLDWDILPLSNGQDIKYHKIGNL